jgi:aryl-alcohol dehydrogenase-like predicted oxidoreductase
MGMSEFYGPSDEAESIATLHRALELGVNFWDTSDMYGSGHNERLLSKVLAEKRDEVVVATKFGVLRGEDGSFTGLCGRAEYVKEACDSSLERLGIESLDLYYQHRVDPQVPIEDTVGAMAELVAAGKVHHLGLSEAAAGTLRRAAKVHPIAALQTEYSLWSRDVEEEILPTCRELGIGLVAYSPLGRGFLSGAIKSLDNLDENDWRRSNPRFQGENFAKNLLIVERIHEIAKEKSCSPAQLALAWVAKQGEDVVPIPGTRRIERLAENAASASIDLSTEELARIEEALPSGSAIGLRYPEGSMALVNG